VSEEHKIRVDYLSVSRKLFKATSAKEPNGRAISIIKAIEPIE